MSFLSSFGRILYTITLIEWLLAALLAVIIFIKGTIVGMMEGNGFFLSMLMGGGYPLLIPIFIYMVASLFWMFNYGWLRVIQSALVMPFVLAFMLLVTLPAAGPVPKARFENLPEAARSSVMVEKAEKELADYRADPTKASRVPTWEAWNNKPFESYIEDLRSKAEEAKQKHESDREAIPPRLRWFWDKTN